MVIIFPVIILKIYRLKHKSRHIRGKELDVREYNIFIFSSFKKTAEYGKMELSMSLFKSSHFHDKFITREFPIVVEMKDHLYVEISMNADGEDILLSPQHCYATLTDNPDDQFKYSIFKDRLV